jgi:Domain of unknown function (DUF4349)
MQLIWGGFTQSAKQRLKTGWLVAAGLAALYVVHHSALQPIRGIAQEKGSGVAQVGWDPISLWRAPLGARAVDKARVLATGVVGGVPGGALMGYVNTSETKIEEDDRKLVRNGSMDLIVQHPADAAESIRQLAEQMGGFLVASDTTGGRVTPYANLTIRVPAARVEEARARIRQLGLRVESEKLQAQDVTRQYVDQAARLRNLRAQETQYLGILKQAKTVKDTLAVSDKLNEVRSEIEQQQAEFEALSKQVETVAITVSLREEAEAQVFGLHWRPLYQLKLAAREGLDAVADYCVAMVGLFFYLPSILLWFMTILVGAAVGWRILRWAARVFFSLPRKPLPVAAK